MNIERLENIGPAPDSGPTGTLALESLRTIHIMLHRHKKVTNLNRTKATKTPLRGPPPDFFQKMLSKPGI